MKLNWGNYIFIFILFFLTLCTIFIIFSLKQDNDLVTENYYNEGADYSTRLEVVKRSQEYHDSIKVIQREDHIAIYPTPAIKTDAVDLDFWFYRPSGKKSDYRINLEKISDSLLIDKSSLQAGRYILKIGWELNKLEYSIEKDMFIEKN